MGTDDHWDRRTRPGQLPHTEGWGASRAERATCMTTADWRRVHPDGADGVVVGAEPAAVPMRMPRRTRTALHGSGADTERGNGSLRNPRIRE